MAKGSFYHSLIAPSLFLSLLLSFLSLAQAQNQTQSHSFSAILVFGDSTVDSGNNNNLSTAFKSNFPPYGMDYIEQRPTGRFSDGRLVTDFIASYVGLKDAIPPYLDQSLSVEELMTGVSFASACSGYDPLTAKLANVIGLPKQLEYFQEYKKRLEAAIGKERTDDHIRRAAFIISAGTNDFVISYFGLGLRSTARFWGIPFRQQRYTVEEYQEFILGQFEEFFQGVWELGARKIAVAGLPPMGCLPIVITTNPSNLLGQRGCIDGHNSAARGYNRKLQDEITAVQKKYENDGGRFVYADIYGPIEEMTARPDKFGLKYTTSGCCGTGLFEATFLCNSKSSVCTNASQYVFFDSIHPTERAYYILFQSVKDLVDFLAK